MKRYLIIAMLALALSAFSCGRGKGSAPKIEDEIQPVTVEELSLRELDDFITVSGKLEGITQVTMSSEASGRVLQVYKKLGDQVSRGERIGRIENDAYQFRQDQAESGLASAQAAFDTAQRNLNYAEESLKRNLISQAEFNGALSAFKGAKAALDGAKAGVEAARSGVSGSFFTAPESGVISNLNITSGQFVAAGQPVATITNASRLIIKTGVGETQIGKLRKGQTVEISQTGVPGTYRGTVRGFGISPLQGSANYPVEIEVASSQGLMPGMVVSARILTERYTDMLYSSLTYFANEFGKTYAFVIDSANKAHKRQVQLGRIIGENVLIESGVEVGDRIVTSGAENLEEGSKVEIRK
jgi:RND family efflux transporter MFP subunit